MKLIDVERFVANKYNHLLTMIVIFLVASSVIPHDEKTFRFRIFTILLLVTVIFCLRVAVVRTRTFWFCVAIAILGCLLDVADSLLERVEVELHLNVLSSVINALFVGTTIVVLMKNMFRANRVTLDIIIGGISVYLLIGILWALFYETIMIFDGDAISAGETFSILYFSFTTLTTLGFGDIAPLSELARIISSFEAVSGQLYLAVFIARLVGLHTAYELRKGETLEKIQDKNIKGNT